MNRRLQPFLIVFALLQFISAHSSGQSIENVGSEVSGSNVHIYYDLLAIPDDQPVFIRVYLSTDGGATYGDALKSVSGDVGMVVGPGKQKKIIWDVFSEVDELVSESVKFRITADPLMAGPERQPLKPGYQAGLSAHLGRKVHLASFGYNLKAAVRLKQFGLGVRGEYYRSYGEPATGEAYDRITGFSGAAFAEYDILRDINYSLYPFLCIGQTKVTEHTGSGMDDYAGYSIYYSAGAGFDFRLAKFVMLGVELEYIMAPVVDIDDQSGSSVVDRVVLDGIWAGITLKFFKQPGS